MREGKKVAADAMLSHLPYREKRYFLARALLFYRLHWCDRFVKRVVEFPTSLCRQVGVKTVEDFVRPSKLADVMS